MFQETGLPDLRRQFDCNQCVEAPAAGRIGEDDNRTKRESQELERRYYGCVLESLPDNVDPDGLRKWDDQACREAEYACEEYTRTWNDAAYHEGDTIRKRMGLPANQPPEDEILLSQLSWESAKRIDDAWVDIRNLKRMLEDSRNTQPRVVASTATGRRVPDLNAG